MKEKNNWNWMSPKSVLHLYHPTKNSKTACGKDWNGWNYGNYDVKLCKVCKTCKKISDKTPEAFLSHDKNQCEARTNVECQH